MRPEGKFGMGRQTMAKGQGFDPQRDGARGGGSRTDLCV